MMLRLSPHVLPQIRQGLHALVPQNLAPGEDRIAYARHVLEIIQGLVSHGRIDEARLFRDEVTFGTRIVQWHEQDGKVSIEPLPELDNALAFQPDELGVLLRDGRIRDDSAMAYLPTGAATAQLIDLLARAHRGISRDELLARAAEHDIGFDEELLEDLLARGVLEPGVAPAPAPPATPSITWIGHAYVCAAGTGTSAWFDPFPAPRLAWTADERASMFPTDVPDSFLLDGYGPDAHQVTQDELPTPDAVFITHQDTDHIDLGTLGLLPPSVPIYVPAADPAMPWQIDLVAAIRNVLGAERDVRPLRHGESVELGDLKVTAFPFVGEFPPSLPHQWNCYYVELPDQVWALCADSAVTDTQVEWLLERRRDDARAFGIMVNQVTTHRWAAGYRDETSEPLNFGRLYSWYVRPARMFERAPTCGVSVELLRRLVADARLAHLYLYAHGNLPWYRLAGTYLHHSHVGSHSLAEFTRMEQLAAQAGVRLLHLRHGRPHVGAPFSALPRRS